MKRVTWASLCRCKGTGSSQRRSSDGVRWFAGDKGTSTWRERFTPVPDA
jgi:hypothetical protein